MEWEEGSGKKAKINRIKRLVSERSTRLGNFIQFSGFWILLNTILWNN